MSLARCVAGISFFCGLIFAPYAQAQFTPPASPSCPARLATVQKVVDGDTLHIRWKDANGDTPITKLRLRLIDAPEICQDLGESARLALAQWVENRDILVTNSCKNDRYGRTLGLVYIAAKQKKSTRNKQNIAPLMQSAPSDLNSLARLSQYPDDLIDIQAKLLASGWVWPWQDKRWAASKNLQLAYQQLHEQAQEHQLGVFKTNQSMPPQEFRATHNSCRKSAQH